MQAFITTGYGIRPDRPPSRSTFSAYPQAQKCPKMAAGDEPGPRTTRKVLPDKGFGQTVNRKLRPMIS